MASWRAPSSILEAPGLDFGASRPRFWSLQAQLWSSWHNCLLCLAFSCFVLLSLAFSCCLLLSLTFSCLLLPALAFSCFLLLSRDSSGFIMRFPFHRYSGFECCIFELPFTPRTRLGIPPNFAKMCFGRFPTFHLNFQVLIFLLNFLDF